MLRVHLIGVLISLIPLSAIATPTITSVSGNIVDSATITISGTSFGSGPTVELYDNFELGVDGDPIAVGTNSAPVGEWGANSGTYSTYSNAQKVSGSLSMRGDWTGPQQWWCRVEYYFPSSARKVYGSWWLYVQGAVPGYNTNEGVNFKSVWLFYSVAQNDIILPNFFNWPLEYRITGNGSGTYNDWIDLDFQVGRWIRISAYVEVASNGAGLIRLWELTSTGVIQRFNETGTWPSGNAFTTIRFNGNGRITPNCYTYFDDVYVASGDNALARIEIGNASTYANCTNLAVCTPTAWGDTSITATVRLGSFTPGQTAYLFVVDSTGSVSSGYQVTIGDSGTQTREVVKATVSGGIVR